MRVDAVLEGLAGVLETRVNVEEGTVTVLFDDRTVTVDEIVQTLDASAYPCSSRGEVRTVGG
ncbi:MAG: hypothetical protein CMJ83_06995 [Planctomycetes bacterium]|nr:hypothetical protein [Planctomycetota bacterium]